MLQCIVAHPMEFSAELGTAALALMIHERVQARVGNRGRPDLLTVFTPVRRKLSGLPKEVRSRVKLVQRKRALNAASEV